MASYTVTTPASGHTGAVGGVTFVDGTATVNEDTHASELAYFRAQGYGVEAVVAEGSAPAEVEEPAEPSTERTDRDVLLAEAAELGLRVHHNAKDDTIRKQIDDALMVAGDSNDDVSDDESDSDEENAS